MKSLRGFLSLFLVLIVGWGCAPAPQIRYPNSQSLLDRLADQTSCSRSIIGDAQLHLSGPFVDVRGSILYRAEAPDRLRFDLYSPLGVTLSTLTTDGQKFSLYELSERSFSYGPAKTCNLARFTRVNVAPLALVEILRGRVPLLEHEPGEIEMRYARPLFGDGKYVLRVRTQQGFEQRVEVAIDPRDTHRPPAAQRLQLQRVRLKYDGRLLYDVRLSDYVPANRAPSELSEEEREMGLSPQPPTGPACEVELPSTVSFSVGKRGYRLHLRNRQVYHNPPVAPGAFTQPLPRGVRALRVDCE